MNQSPSYPHTPIVPYGGRLVNLTAPAKAYEDLKTYACHLPSIQISPRSVADLELLAAGAFSPLDRFMGQADYLGVLNGMRLADGTLFPVPVTLPVEPSFDLRLGQAIALRGSEYELLAVLTLEEIYPWDRQAYGEKVFGARALHGQLPAGLHRWGSLNLSGHLQMLHVQAHYDFSDLRRTPAQTRSALEGMNKRRVLSFLPSHRLPLHGEWLPDLPSENGDTALLLLLASGQVRPGDFDHYTRVRLYRALTGQPSQTKRALLSLLPLNQASFGLREVLWQALVSRNYGANGLIVPPEPGSNQSHLDDEALLKGYLQELGVELHVETPKGGASFRSREARPLMNTTEHREVDAILREAKPPRHQQGVCVWFTGLSGAGKSTTAEILSWLVLEHGRRVTVLDGDVVRTHLSKGLGFSKEDRDTNVRRIGFVASELVRLGGVVICSVVSPYRAARGDVRLMVGPDHFIEVFVDTPLEICEARDVKGMYARARSGKLNGFTGIDDPYEPPEQPEIILETVNRTPEDNARLILDDLIRQGYILDEKNAGRPLTESRIR